MSSLELPGPWAATARPRPGGPRIEADELIRGRNVVIEDGVRIKGGRIELGDGVIVRRGAVIEVTGRLSLGKGSIVGEGAIIRGRDIALGREFYANHHAEIGGGSCFERTSRLAAGYWCHLGSYAMVNTAMPVTIGNECGFGRFTNLYTHGAYQSALDGFPASFAPITIGDRVWAPAATINPGVTVGSCAVIAAGSVVTMDVPAGCLAGGIPCKVLRENQYPRKRPLEEKLAAVDQINALFGLGLHHKKDGIYAVDQAEVDFDLMALAGRATPASERCRNVLRRWGIRFRYEAVDGSYAPWA